MRKWDYPRGQREASQALIPNPNHVPGPWKTTRAGPCSTLRDDYLCEARTTAIWRPCSRCLGRGRVGPAACTCAECPTVSSLRSSRITSYKWPEFTFLLLLTFLRRTVSRATRMYMSKLAPVPRDSRSKECLQLAMDNKYLWDNWSAVQLQAAHV